MIENILQTLYSINIMIDPTTLKIIKVILGTLWGLLSMRIAFYFFDKITPFNTSKMLAEDNMSVAIVVASINIGIGICVGLIVGLSLF